jgi:hypothetical protein
MSGTETHAHDISKSADRAFVHTMKTHKITLAGLVNVCSGVS